MKHLWFNLLILLVLLAGCAPQSWKQDPDVQAAKRDCAGLPQGEHYGCIERHAVASLNPEACRLAGSEMADKCRQAVLDTLAAESMTVFSPAEAQALVSFPLLVPDPATLPPGLAFVSAEVFRAREKEAVALTYQGNGLDLSIQQITLPAPLAPPNQPYKTVSVRGYAGWLVTLPTAPDLHSLVWEEDGRSISLSGNLLPETLLDIAQGLQPLSRTLPIPTSAEDAALTGLHPLTTSGLAWFGDWAPDGESLVYTVATEPPLLYGRWSGWPEFEVWWMRADGSGARRLAQGHSPFFSADGRTVFFLHRPLYSNLRLWAVDVRGGAPRRLVGPIGGLTVHQLDDGRLVVSESGTYAPLRLFDPATGALSDLTGPWPTNFPERARLSPDGTRLAYPHEQEQAVYLAEADGSNPRLLSQDGGFGARVWWSPDSQWLAYTTGNHHTDRLMVADRDGGNQVVLLPNLEESGYVASLSWSPDSRMLLVAAEAYSHQTPRPTRLLLLDADGSGQRQLLEAYLHDASWSPDGRTLALSRWGGPQGELASHNIWLATLTDRTTVAKLPPPTPEPLPTATPPLPLPAADLSPEEVIRRFWEAIDAGNHLTAWACLATQRRARQGLAYFTAEWRCVHSAQVVGIRSMYTKMGAETERQMFQVKVDLEMAGDCFSGLPPGPFTLLVREGPDGPWLIDSFNTGP